jgi:hypothetical protein
MKMSRILINGIIIFVCIALFFLLMEVTHLSDQIYLRLVNFIFVIYGINRTIKLNFKDRIDGYFTNFIAAVLTGIVSLVLGLISFIAYVEYRGGEDYLRTFAESFIFGGGDPSIYQFCIGLFLEGAAASVIVSFALMQYWKDKVEKINRVDDGNHKANTSKF